jgi:hypothetical protein
MRRKRERRSRGRAKAQEHGYPDKASMLTMRPSWTSSYSICLTQVSRAHASDVERNWQSGDLADIPDELVQSTAMEWVLTFLEFAQNTVVAFTPRIVPAILPNLASSK